MTHLVAEKVYSKSSINYVEKSRVISRKKPWPTTKTRSIAKQSNWDKIELNSWWTQSIRRKKSWQNRCCGLCVSVQCTKAFKENSNIFQNSNSFLPDIFSTLCYIFSVSHLFESPSILHTDFLHPSSAPFIL